MKKFANKIIAAMLTLITAAAMLAGCTGSGSAQAGEIQAVAIVLGYHANSQDLNLSSPTVKNAVAEAISSNGFVSVVSVDGSPDLIGAMNYQVDDRYTGNQSLLEVRNKENTAALLSELTTVRANDEEVDTLEALRLAVRTLASAPEDSAKTILVVDTGLSTTGLLDFRNNLINADPENVAQQLADKEAIPDFTGTHVIWQQLGDVSAPQDELTPAQRKNLTAIWEAIVTAGGGTFEADETVANEAAVDANELPTVSTVSLPAETAVEYDASALNFDTPQFLSEEQVRFVGDSAEYLSESDAVEVITPIADYMKANPGFSILLIGTTAGDENTDYSMELSARRAEAVKATLVSLGIEEGRIRTLGMGSADPWHVYNLSTSDPLSSQNRKVVMLDGASELASQLLAG